MPYITVFPTLMSAVMTRNERHFIRFRNGMYGFSFLIVVMTVVPAVMTRNERHFIRFRNYMALASWS